MALELQNQMAYEPDKFVSTAQQYCAWAENNSLAQEEEVKKAISLIADLYSSAIVLPKQGCGEDVDGEEVTHEEWKLIYKRFGSLPVNYYSVFFSPANTEDAPVTGDVADDLADIYRDLKDGLWLYDNGHFTEAIWEWKQSFNTHWGRHLVSLLHVLHCYMADEYIEL